MVAFLNALFVASLSVSFAVLATGQNLSALVRATKYPPITNPTPAQVNFVTYGNANPPGSVLVNGGTVRIMRGDNGAGTVFTTWACTTLNQANVNNGDGTNQATRDFATELGQPGDQAGHIFADSLGYTGKEFWNIMPMRQSVNSGHYGSAELQIRTELAKRGSFFMYVRGEYATPTSTRPDTIYMYIHQPGVFECLWIVQN